MNIFDEKVLELYNTENKHAFDTFFHAFYPSLCYFTNKIVQDRDAACDIVQEVFINIWSKKLKFDNIILLKSYLYKSAHNGAVNHLSKRSNREKIAKNIQLSNPPDQHEIALFEVETDVFQQIFTAIEELPEECRRVFKMSYLENMDVKSIEETLGISASTIMTQRQRAKKYLRERLKGVELSVLALFSII